MKFTKAEVLKAAKQKALSYLPKEKKTSKKKISSKEQRTIKLAELAGKVGGCQQEDLLNLVDEITGLPVSKIRLPEKTERISFGINGPNLRYDYESSNDEGYIGEPTAGWLNKRPLMVLVSLDNGVGQVSLGYSGGVLSGEGVKTCMYGRLRVASKMEIEIFFDGLCDEHIKLLSAGLIE